jgi:serine/threonine protein kinase
MAPELWLGEPPTGQSEVYSLGVILYELCAGKGHAGCADFHQWQSTDGSGGELARYDRAETGSVTYVVMGCAAVPPPTKYIAGATRQLGAYTCACY